MNGPMKTTVAAALYGFSGPGGRRRFIAYVEERERALGVSIFDRRPGGQREITDRQIRRYMPQLSSRSADAIAKMVRSEIASLKKELTSSELLDEQIAKTRTITTINERLEQVTELLELIAAKIGSHKKRDDP